MNCGKVFPVLPIKCFVVRFHLYSLWVSLAVCLQFDGNSDQCAAVHYVHVSNTANTFWMFWMRKTLRHVRAKFLLEPAFSWDGNVFNIVCSCQRKTEKLNILVEGQPNQEKSLFSLPYNLTRMFADKIFVVSYLVCFSEKIIFTFDTFIEI